MAEVPEVEIIVRDLREAMVGRTIRAAEVLQPEDRLVSYITYFQALVFYTGHRVTMASGVGELDFGRDENYVVSAFDIDWDWKHKTPGEGGWMSPLPNTVPDLAMAMTFNPGLNVLVLQGYYDLATPYLATKNDVAHLDITPEARKRVDIQYYDAGHMMYLHAPSMKKFRAGANEEVLRLIHGGFNGRMTNGDTYGIWVVSAKPQIGTFPMQVWDPAHPLELASIAGHYLRNIPNDGRADFADLLKMLSSIVSAVGDLNILIFTDGETMFKGSPADEKVNQQLKDKGKEDVAPASRSLSRSRRAQVAWPDSPSWSSATRSSFRRDLLALWLPKRSRRR